MQYKAYFNFYMPDGEANVYDNSDLPVSGFQADGDASRIINLHSTDDIGVLSQLEQARSLKSIVLYLSSTKDHKDMKASMDLTTISLTEKYLRMMLVVERYSGGKMLEGLGLFSSHSELKNPPTMGKNNDLVVTINLTEDIEIYRGKVSKHNMSVVVEI